MLRNSDAADVAFRNFEILFVFPCNFVEYAPSFGKYFRSNSVAW